MREAKERKVITVLATSDLHGHLYPYNYMENKETKAGSLAQISTAVKELYDPETMILADCGDTIQDNYAELFLEDEIHPMMEAINDIGYEIWTTGNHDYDFGMEPLKRIIGQFKGNAVLGNVFDQNGARIARPYVILEKCGIRIAVLCMVTPNIRKWSESVLKGYTVTNPIEETEKLLSELEGKYDVLLGFHHMGIKDELGMEGSGAESFLMHFPEFDAVMASHEHKLCEGRMINGVLVAENYGAAKSMIKITLELGQSEGKWKAVGKTSEAILMENFEPDPAVLKKYRSAHERALENTRRVIGTVMGDRPFGGENPVESLPESEFKPTPMMTLLNRVLRYCADADVSCAAMSKCRTNLKPGSAAVSDAAWLFPYRDTVNKLRMTGRQLRKYMEFNAEYYRTFQEGDLTITVNPEWEVFHHVYFSGVYYEINISREPGHRIEVLNWPDGRPVRDADEFTFAVCSFCYASFLNSFGPVFSEEDGLPQLIEANVRPDLEYFPFMIIDYIEHILHGIIQPENENNWKLTGYSWDESLHRKALQYLAEGYIAESLISDVKKHNIRPIRLEHIRMAEEKAAENKEN